MLPIVFVDADVIYSSTLRSWLFNLSAGIEFKTSPAFEVVVSEDVIAEAVARWRDANPTAHGGVVTTMSNNLRELCTVVRDYDCSMPFPGADEGDIHVHAAALASKAGYLVTNDNGFHSLPADVQDGLEYEIYRPDDFFVLASKQSQQRTLEATRKTLRYYASTPGESQMVAKLEAAGCAEFAAIVDEHLMVLAGEARPDANKHKS